uniref:Cell division protein n=1 Tax=Chlorella variabilis TaxID=554065 RepID=F2YGI6_CHLVA|nr:cell division protein [Chlorella variabilis]ADZ04994.1 cell division protein [Chlorella variabilis]AIH00159.1 putative plastid division protein [Chlorella variabilis]AJP09489.1 putative plastid division protein [Chlorella variabilis]
MRTEKELNLILETRNPNSDEKNTRKSKLKNWVSNQRSISRYKIRANFTQINFSTFLTFLPLALGFSQFLAYHLNSSKTESFFEANLPVFKTFKPKISFETVEYIAKANSLYSWDLNNLEKNNLQKKFNPAFSSDHTFLFGQPYFLAKIKKIPNQKTFFCRDNKQFTALSCDFYLIPSGNFMSKISSIEGFSRKLDELPAYVKGLKQKSSFSPPLAFSSTSEKFQPKQNLLLKTHKKEFTPQYKLWKQVEKKLNLVQDLDPIVQKFPTNFSETASGQFTKNEIFQSHDRFGRRSEFYKNRFDFYNKVNQLNSELQNLFIEKNISYSPNHLVENYSPDLQVIEDASISEKILEKLEKKQISEDLIGCRIMSGYVYPDMKTNDLEWFYTLNKIGRFNRNSFFTKRNFITSKSSDLKIKEQTVNFETSGFPLYSQKYRFRINNLPKILLETKNILLTNREDNKIFYKGSSLLLDFQKSFDWKNLHEENLRSWFHNYLSPSNPLVQLRQNFFGNYYSPQFLVDTKIANFSDFTTKSFLRLKFIKTPETSWQYSDWIYEYDSVQSLFVPWQSSLHIPSETKKENQIFKEENLKGLFLTLSKQDSNEVKQFLPIIQLKQPIWNNFNENLNFFDGYTPLFEFGVKGNPDYTFSPLCSDKKRFVKKHASGQYRKLSSLFSKKQHSNLICVDNWEPLTSTSWLVVSQLSFAIFIFHILKSLADSYGRELLGYLLDLVAALGILDDSLKQQIEILTGQRNKGFRIVLNSQKKFSDIVGIQKLLLEIYEVVLFLRNSARDFALSKTLPHGILLTGPPGTGKTLLVQALAGEAQVPIIVLSGSSLIEPGESASFKLQMVFQEARQLAPCIVFIDEIDTLSSKRSQIVQNPMATDEGFESFLESLILESISSTEKTKHQARKELLEPGQEKQDIDNQRQKQSYSNSDQKEKQLSLLSQLLIELDGIQGRDGVVVIGATNRPEVLDPAVLRPGRFDKIIQVGLPDEQKRVKILQFYGQNLGYQKNLPWNYLGERTAGFTAADLATLMNESTIKAILNNSTHTIETIEHGIDRLTTSESEKYTVFKTKKTSDKKEKSNTLSISSKMSILRLAYYQAGKIILSYALETHPKSVIASLWPRRPTIRSVEITTNLQNSLFEFARLCEITDRLVGCYAGKAAEFLFLQKFSPKGLSQTSTLGLDDLVFAQKLVYFMLEQCCFYSKKSHIQQTISLLPNINMREFRKNPEKLDLYSELVGRIQLPPMWEAIEAETSSLRSKKEKENDAIDLEEQIHYTIPWWQQEISDEFEFKPKNPGKGSRLYLYNPERTQRNPEWLPPDEFYHVSSGLKNVKTAFTNILRVKRQKQAKSSEKTQPDTHIDKKRNKSQKVYKVYFPWNDVPNLTRDYSAHSLVLQSFNKALVILNQNRELLDRLVVELLYQEILRKPDIEKLVTEFEIRKTNTLIDETEIKDRFEPPKLVEFVEFPWGTKSRKPLPRWIDFAGLREETT